MLTIETPGAELDEAWAWVSQRTFEYRVYLDDALGETEPLTGNFELVGRGAANYATAGEPTDVFRAWVDLPPGLHGVGALMRDQDGEVIVSLGPDLLRVTSDARTEWYQLFDLRTFDPWPVSRSIDLTVEAPEASGDVEIDRVEYAIACGDALYVDGEFLPLSSKRSIGCASQSEGLLEQAGRRSAGPAPWSVPTTLWQAQHDAGCFQCGFTVTARDVEGTALCSSELVLDLDPWSDHERPAEQVYIALSCAGGSE